MIVTSGAAEHTMLRVFVHENNDPDADPSAGCQINEVHHYGPDGKHWCPTGFLWCRSHGAPAGTIDGPGACHRWGK